MSAKETKRRDRAMRQCRRLLERRYARSYTRRVMAHHPAVAPTPPRRGR